MNHAATRIDLRTHDHEHPEGIRGQCHESAKRIVVRAVDRAVATRRCYAERIGEERYHKWISFV